MYSVTKRMTFEAAHSLNLDYESPCKNFHGHSYKVEVKVSASILDDHDMVVDFTILNQIKKFLDENWDHGIIIGEGDPKLNACKQLSSTIYILKGCKNATAENMCKYLHDKSRTILSRYINAPFEVKIKIYETENNFAEYIEHIQ